MQLDFSMLVGWLVGFWCTHFRDLAPLIKSVLVLVSRAKVKAFYGIASMFYTYMDTSEITVKNYGFGARHWRGQNNT